MVDGGWWMADSVRKVRRTRRLFEERRGFSRAGTTASLRTSPLVPAWWQSPRASTRAPTQAHMCVPSDRIPAHSRTCCAGNPVTRSESARHSASRGFRNGSFDMNCLTEPDGSAARHSATDSLARSSCPRRARQASRDTRSLWPHSSDACQCLSNGRTHAAVRTGR